VGDDHVLVRPGRLVEVGPAVQAEGLGDVDLDVIDEVAVPDRLEQAVGEPEGQDVERGLLPRKWSIRKIWFSSKVSCTWLFSLIALARSVPNGFSMITRDRSTRSASRRVLITAGAAAGGTLR
jgi:hypothetical protein